MADNLLSNKRDVHERAALSNGNRQRSSHKKQDAGADTGIDRPRTFSESGMIGLALANRSPADQEVRDIGTLFVFKRLRSTSKYRICYRG